MSYKVTITYAGVTADPAQLVAPVCSIYIPHNNYTETPAYVTGVEDEYGKSVYATNTPSKGFVPAREPYATTGVPLPVPMAQFKMSMVAEDNVVTFTVSDYKEAFYYMQLGIAMAEQGFEVTVEEDSDSDDSEGG